MLYKRPCGKHCHMYTMLSVKPGVLQCSCELVTVCVASDWLVGVSLRETLAAEGQQYVRGPNSADGAGAPAVTRMWGRCLATEMRGQPVRHFVLAV